MSLDTADLQYIAKLKASKRDRRLIAAFLLLLFALRRLRPGASRPEIETELAPIVGALGAGIAGYVAKQLHDNPPSRADRRAVAVPLLAAIALHAANAAKLAREERNERLGLIARAETQTATAEATRRAAGTRTLTRTVTSNNPCDKCLDLAGTYNYPWPDDVFYSHPNCCCLWETNDAA
jgi:hypothetical protein